MNLIQKKRGLYAGFLGFINGLSWAFGPLLGGFLDDTVSLTISAMISSGMVLAGIILINNVPEYSSG